MKKIHLILKTHLDIGFTDFADVILRRYRDEFIPNAITLAEKMNTADKKAFVWTTGSYLIKDSLENASEENKKRLIEAIKRGDIAWHALPFTTHTELLDEETFGYGLSIARKLDLEFNRSTISAKMTDVPGHTVSMLPLLKGAGIKFLHIGVNDASAVPKVPDAFVWKNGDAEVLVVYEGSYGSLYKNDHMDDILYFFHSSDNHGPSNEQELRAVYKRLKREYPNYEVIGSTLDDYAKELLKVKNKLPVVECEIGDTWIHGAASDPYKSAAIRTLMKLKRDWLENGEMWKGSAEYESFSDYILRAAEHTWGLDVKRHFSDYDNMLKKDFERARKKDKTGIKLNFHNIAHKYLIKKCRAKGEYLEGSYSKMEKSWQDERSLIDRAVDSLADDHKAIAVKALSALIPLNAFNPNGLHKNSPDSKYKLGAYTLGFDENGLKTLLYKDVKIMDNKSGLSTFNYHSLTYKDYDFWLNNYTRNHKTNWMWSEGDFLRPGYKHFYGKYPGGRFNYKLKDLLSNDYRIMIKLEADEKLTKETGAPKTVEIMYSIEEGNLAMEILWLEKDASRLSEISYVNFPLFEAKKLMYKKLGKLVNPYNVIKDGGRNLSAVERIDFKTDGYAARIYNLHSPLVSMGEGKILRFDNEYGNIENYGVSFVLHNNVWGTNFPLWYSDNAYFKYLIDIKKDKN